MMVKGVEPVLARTLDDLAHFILQRSISPKANIELAAIKRAEGLISKVYGQAIHKLLLVQAENIPFLAEPQVVKLMEAMCQSGNLRGVFFLIATGHELPNFSRKTIEEGARRIIFGREAEAGWWIYMLLGRIPGLPGDLIQEGMRRNRKGSTFWLDQESEIANILDAFLPQWLVGKNLRDSGRRFFLSPINIPIFDDEKWKLIERTAEGALIQLKWDYYITLQPEARTTQVVLLPDVSHPDRGYAVEVSAEVNTVHEARAWMYRQDSGEWKGFDREV